MRRLYSRIYFHFIGVLLLVGIISSVVLTAGWRRTFVHGWMMKLAHHAASVIAVASEEKRADFVKHLSEELDIDVTLLALDGQVLVQAGGAIEAPDRAQLDDARHRPTVIHQHHSLSVATPVIDRAGRPTAIVQIAPMRRFGPGTIWRPLVLVALMLLVVAAATGPLARRISRPVERLTEASRRLGGGDLSHRVQPPRHRFFRRHHHKHRHLDELEQLTRAWNEMAERVEKLVRGQRELLANISHELRSPLQRIQVALELLPVETQTSARIADVRVDLAELERLIDDVLTTSRLDDTGLPTHLDEVDVSALLKQISDRAGHDPATAGMRVRVDGANAGKVSADGALLKRALWNLVENAAKYGASPITLSAERANDKLRLAVADEGPGVPAAERERVLDPFYRAGDKARTSEAKRGFGLGLTLAR
jgi:signal transduction histidine kinase